MIATLIGRVASMYPRLNPDQQRAILEHEVTRFTQLIDQLHDPAGTDLDALDRLRACALQASIAHDIPLQHLPTLLTGDFDE